MGRKSVHKIGDFFGKLEVLEVISSNKTGSHVKLKCKCHYCDTEKIMSAVNIKRRNSCGCQQKNSETWKSVGAKNKPWQLAYGQAARNNLEFQYKRGAKKRGLDYSLSTEEFDKLVIGICYYCGDSLTNTIKGQGKTSGDFKYTGIDRVDSTKGYILDNCVPCCWMCNNMKNTTDKDVFINHIKKIYENIEQ